MTVNWIGNWLDPFGKRLAESPFSKKHSTLEIAILLQVTLWNNNGANHICGCKWFFKITTYLQQKYLSDTMYHIYAIHDSKCSSKKYSFHWKMNDCNYFDEIKKYYVQLNIVTYNEYCFRNHYNYSTAFSYQLLFH